MLESLQNTLAYHVLEEPESWLGFPSPSGLEQFLIGAEWRVTLCSRDHSAMATLGTAVGE